ncbi:MFS transporter [Thiorhodospira sibirica]|uniref:MFS transporter n=1 Tax=Thiorhodospira sibirica TaxID=154347 RepID=UPI00022C4661|nr:MFS transporter [Thiorhodospira sibirica]
MFASLLNVYSLLLGMGILLAGSGLLGTLLGLRAGLEAFPQWLIGLIMSAFFIGYVLGSYLCPMLIRRVGHIRAFVVFAAIASVASFAHGLLVYPLLWWILRVVVGVSVLGLYMVVESWLNETVRQQRGQVFAIYMMISLIALGLGQYLILLYGPGELASFALVAMLFCLGLIPVAMTQVSQPTQVEIPRFSFRTLYRASPVGFWGTFTSGMITGGFWGLSALYAQSIGLSNVGIASFVSAAILGGALLQWPIGLLSDHRDRRIVLALVCIAGAVATVGIFLVAGQSLPGLLAMTVLYGGFSFSLYALCVAHTHDRADISQVLEITRGLLLLNGIGASFGPIIGGLVMQFGSSARLPLVFGAIMVMLSLFTLYRIYTDRPVPPEERSVFVPVTRTSAMAAELDPRSDLERELELKPPVD